MVLANSRFQYGAERRRKGNGTNDDFPVNLYELWTKAKGKIQERVNSNNIKAFVSLSIKIVFISLEDPDECNEDIAFSLYHISCLCVADFYLCMIGVRTIAHNHRWMSHTEWYKQIIFGHYNFTRNSTWNCINSLTNLMQVVGKQEEFLRTHRSVGILDLDGLISPWISSHLARFQKLQTTLKSNVVGLTNILCEKQTCRHRK